MANKKPILLYQEGQQDQNHDVVQDTDVIDASHLAVLSTKGIGQAIEVIEDENENFLFVQGIVAANKHDIKFTRLRTVNGAISPHMTAPFTPEKDNHQYLAAPLPEPRSWAKVKVHEHSNQDSSTDYLIPVYHHIDLNKLEENYAQISDGFDTVTMASMGIDGTTALRDDPSSQGGSFKYVEGRQYLNADGDDFVNADVYIHLKTGETQIHRGPVTFKDLGTLARTAGHYAAKIVLHARDVTAVPAPQPTPTEYQRATLLWTTDIRLKNDVARGAPTLFVDTRNTLVLCWGEGVNYNTENKYIIIKF